MARKPLPHQRRVLAWAQHRDRIGLLLRMRLGKSYCLIRWASQRVKSRGLRLVVAPLSVLPGWVEELAAEGLPSTLLTGSSKRKLALLDAAPANSWVLLNPEGLRACPELADREFALVALDESTFIKNSRSKIAKVVRRRFKHVKHKAILCGEPAPESDLEWFEQLAFLSPDGRVLGCDNFWVFRNRLCYQAGFEWRLKTGVKRRLEREVAKHCIVMTEKEAGMETRTIFQKRHVELPAAVRGIYKRLLTQWAAGGLETKWSPVVYGWLRQLAGGTIPLGFNDGKAKFSPHKFNELEALLFGELKHASVVVFFRFNRELQLAATRLRKRGLEVDALSGLTPLDRRAKAIRSFKQGRRRVLLLQSRIAQYGLDLSRADTAIVFSNHDDANTRNQLLARIRHPAKRRPAHYIDLVTVGTVDLPLLRALGEKQRSSLATLSRVQQLVLESLERNDGRKRSP